MAGGESHAKGMGEVKKTVNQVQQDKSYKRPRAIGGSPSESIRGAAAAITEQVSPVQAALLPFSVPR